MDSISQKENGFEYPEDEYAQSLLNALSPFGEFAFAEPEGKQVNVVLLKHFHGTKTEMAKAQEDEAVLKEHIRHQDNFFEALVAGFKLHQSRARFVLEKIDRICSEWTPQTVKDMGKARHTDNMRTQGDTGQFDLICRKIMERSDHSPFYFLDILDGNFRFAAQCSANNGHLLLPGKPKDYNKLGEIASDFHAIVRRAATEHILDGEIAGLPAKWDAIRAEDADTRHGFVQSQIAECPDDVHTIYIGYGLNHSENGYHKAKEEILMPPLEKYLTDYRLFVFDPSGIDYDKSPSMHYSILARTGKLRAYIDNEVRLNRQRIIQEMLGQSIIVD